MTGADPTQAAGEDYRVVGSSVGKLHGQPSQTRQTCQAELTLIPFFLQHTALGLFPW